MKTIRLSIMSRRADMRLVFLLAFLAGIFCLLPSNCDSSANQLESKKQEPVAGQRVESSLRWLALERLKRAAKSRPKLAQMPRTTTTSTTTTTTSTTTQRSAEKSAAEDTADYSNSDDYESIESSKSKAAKSSVSSSRKMPKVTTTTEAPAPEDESEAGDGEEGGDDAEESTTITKSSVKSPKLKSQQSSGKSKQQQPLGNRKLGKASTSEQAKEQRVKASESSRADEEAEADNEETGDETDEQKATKGKGVAEAPSTTSPKSATTKATRPKKKPLVRLPSFLIRPKNESACTPEAYLEFPRDLIGDKWRSRGLVLIHVAVVCYMFYSLALVCERYFMPSLEEFSQRLGLSEDVAGATLMSAGSSAPELFTAILGVFVAKGDVGTGAIVGSAVFNILFVIGICAFVTTSTAPLNWWPVLRDSVYYTFTVLVLIVFIYDERITAIESFIMIALYGVYILIMVHNLALKQQVTLLLQSNPVTAALLKSAVSMDGPDDVFGGGSTSSANRQYATTCLDGRAQKQTDIEEDSVFLAAQLVIVRHKRLFRPTLRFQSAARYIIVKRQHRRAQQTQEPSGELNYFGPESEPLRPSSGQSAANQRDRMEAYAKTATASKSKFSIVSKDDYEFWNRPPEEHENYYLWMAKIPVNYVLHYTTPDCSLYPDKYLFTFFISIIWTAVFSYIMVWMVTLIGYTFGIPDSVMGVTFLAAGTSVPDCYSSIHAARNGMADMAVSNSIGSNVFDILIGLSLPWFIQTAIYPGVVATINSRGVIYSVILLFLSLVVTIYLMNKYEWTLKPRLGLALLIAYGLFIILTCMLEFNLFGHVNPPPCLVVGDS